MDILVDLVSDTVTRPNPGMLAAMSAAQLGDEQREGDPTTQRLCDAVSEMLGKESSLFLPSGTMCNLIAAAVLCKPGEAFVAERTAHVIASEMGGVAAIAGALAVSVAGNRGQFSPADVLSAMDTLVGQRAPRARLLWVEQTHNRGGGSIWPLQPLQELTAFARTHGLCCHMDGARLLNAVAATGIAAAEYAAPFDSTWIDLSKGLGCPAGAVLSGSREFIAEAEVWKRRLGGALRQSGVLAAAGLHALNGWSERLQRDHALARRLADGLRGIDGVTILFEPVETNLVFVDVGKTTLDAPTLAGRLREHGVRVGLEGRGTVRLVTHQDVDDAGIDHAVAACRRVLRR